MLEMSLNKIELYKIKGNNAKVINILSLVINIMKIKCIVNSLYGVLRGVLILDFTTG